MSFALKFSPEVTSIVRLKSRDPVREFIQTKLRELIPERKTNLVIIPDTLHLLGNCSDSSVIILMLLLLLLLLLLDLF